MRPSIETITPARAKTLLNTSPGNRHLRPEHIRRVASDIASGRYKLTGEAIRIDEEGLLCDGHHRLYAIIDAAMPVETMVIYDFPRSLVPYLDNQIAPRSGADALHFEGDEAPNAKERAATIQLLEAFRKGRPHGGKLVLSNPEMIERFKDMPQRFSELVSKAKTARHVLPATYLAATVWAGTAREEYAIYADSFLEDIATGAMLASGSPIHTLREWAFKEKQATRRASRVERINAVIHTWNAYVSDRAPARIKSAVNPKRLIGSTSETFKSWA